MSADNTAAVEKKMIELRSSDGEVFQVEEKAAVLSVTIKNLVEDECVDSVVPMPNVTRKTLAKVIEYCKKHVEDDTVKANSKEFDAEFVKVERGELFQLILAAHYMNIKGLIELLSRPVVHMVQDMKVEEVRKLLLMTLTPEEKEAIRQE